MVLNFTFEEGLLVWALVHVWLTRRPGSISPQRMEQLRVVDQKFERAYEAAEAIS